MALVSEDPLHFAGTTSSHLRDAMRALHVLGASFGQGTPDYGQPVTDPAFWIHAAKVALALPADVSARLLGEGQFCVAVLVEPDIVVRFPRHALGIEQLLQERQVVGILGGALVAVVPTPLAAELDNPPGQAFASHRLVPGDLVTQDVLNDLGRSDTDQLHDQVASLLLGLESGNVCSEDRWGRYRVARRNRSLDGGGR